MIMQELTDRLPEIYLYAEDQSIVAQPHTYPPGLFRHRSTDFRVLVREIEQDVARLKRYPDQSSSQAYLAQLILRKINVLISNAKQQKQQRSTLTQTFIQQMEVDEGRAQQQQRLQHKKREIEQTIEKLERTLARQHSPKITELKNNCLRELDQLQQQLKRLQQLPLFMK